ncbi:LIC11966 family surface protein [Psychroserpens mesophilus]|uniref:LIC11966 family surface protein n=1 Tax=Psychroserpens mesophilus TaxID=325473 RepID=UPI003D65914F
MKHITLILGLCCILTSNLTTAQNFANASEYLDFVAEEQQAITKNMWKYTKAVAHSKSDRSIDGKRKNLLKTIDKAISKIEKANGFDGDDYKNQVLKHMRLNKSLLNHEYAEIVDMKAVAEQSYDAMEAYIIAQEMADKKMEESQKEYETNFYAFADKHDIKIIESENDLGKKMKISNEVFEHYNDMYLVYFKVYINEVYLWEAVESNDVSAIQQNANALNVAAKEGLEILKTQPKYKNDDSVINATKTAFEFFIDETENKMPQLTDFLILNEDFEKIKNSLEQTPERERTKEQIDAYNKKVKDINTAVKNYNKVNTELNTKRQATINGLNNTNANFLANHIPND